MSYSITGRAYRRASEAGEARGQGGPKYHAAKVAGQARRGPKGSGYGRVVRALDALEARGEPITYGALVDETGILRGTISSILPKVRRAGWRWGRLVPESASKPAGEFTLEELWRRAATVRAQSIAATRDRARPRTLSMLGRHAPAPVPPKEQERARRACDQMRRDGRRRGLLLRGKKAGKRGAA